VHRAQRHITSVERSPYASTANGGCETVRTGDQPMPKKSAIVTNACDYGGPAAGAALLDAGYHVSASDQRFTSSEQRQKFDAANSGAQALASDSPEELVASVLAEHGQIDRIVSND